NHGEDVRKCLVIQNLQFFVGRYDAVKDEIVSQIERRKSLIILACSLHDLALISSYPTIAQSYHAIDICTTDGMWLVWWATWRTRLKVERVYGPDLTRSIMRDTQSNRFRHVFCGSSPGHLK